MHLKCSVEVLLSPAAAELVGLSLLCLDVVQGSQSTQV